MIDLRIRRWSLSMLVNMAIWSFFIIGRARVGKRRGIHEVRRVGNKGLILMESTWPFQRVILLLDLIDPNENWFAKERGRFTGICQSGRTYIFSCRTAIKAICRLPNLITVWQTRWTSLNGPICWSCYIIFIKALNW